MEFRPLHDRVVIRRIDSDDKSAGGIIIPDTAQEKPQEGEVIAVGPGARGDDNEIVALDVKAGDHILFGKWSGTEVKIDGEDLLIMKGRNFMNSSRSLFRAPKYAPLRFHWGDWHSSIASASNAALR